MSHPIFIYRWYIVRRHERPAGLTQAVGPDNNSQQGDIRKALQFVVIVTYIDYILGIYIPPPQTLFYSFYMIAVIFL